MGPLLLRWWLVVAAVCAGLGAERGLGASAGAGLCRASSEPGGASRKPFWAASGLTLCSRFERKTCCTRKTTDTLYKYVPPCPLR